MLRKEAMLKALKKHKNLATKGLFVILAIIAGILYCLPDDNSSSQDYVSKNGEAYTVTVRASPAVSNLPDLTSKLNEQDIVIDSGVNPEEEQNTDISLLDAVSEKLLPTSSIEFPEELQEPTKAVKININTADKTLLMSLPGIGEKKAETIIEYRKTNGPFKDITDIMMVPGIKEASFEKLKELITTE